MMTYLMTHLMDMLELLESPKTDVEKGIRDKLFEAVNMLGLQTTLYNKDTQTDHVHNPDSKVEFKVVEAKNGIDPIAIMIECGAAIDITSKSGYTPLMLAIKYNDLRLAKNILTCGADPNFFDRATKLSPLHVAITTKNKEAVTLLLENSARAEPLLENIDTEGIELLANCGVDLSLKLPGDETFLHRAAGSGNHELLRLILEKTGSRLVNLKAGEIGKTPLIMAAEKGNIEMIRLLLNNGAHVKRKDDEGRTALHFAAKYGTADMVTLLIAHEGNLKMGDNSDLTPLHWAVVNNNVETAQVLLEKGADIEENSKNRWTPLHMAAHHGKKDAVLLLLDKGAAVNSKNDEGHTPLQLAQNSSNGGDIIELLTARGGVP